MPITKTLLTCTPREFLIQTNRMKKAVERWATETDIKHLITQKAPDIEALTGDEAKDEVIKARNAERATQQNRLNLSAIFDAALEEHTDETLEIIGMMFFMTADELNELQSRELLIPLNEMLNDEAIIGFFSTLFSTVRAITAK